MSDLRENSTKKNKNITHQNSNNINIICNLYNNIMTDQNENFISSVFLKHYFLGVGHILYYGVPFLALQSIASYY